MRRDFILTDEMIRKTYVDIIRKEGRMPTQVEVAEKCNITRETVRRHLNKINLKDLVQPFKIFGNDVLMGLRNRATKGDVQAAKLFFTLIFDWSEKTEQKIEHSGEVKTIIEVHYDEEGEDEQKRD